jgi:hypothetical protein
VPNPRKPSWWGRRWRALVGGALLTLSIGATVLIAWRGANEPPSTAEAALFVLIAAGFQIAAASIFAAQGRADPTHATSSFRHLARMAKRAVEATEIAERANRRAAAEGDVRAAVTRLSVHLSWLQEGLEEAGEHWAQVHPELRDLTDQDLEGKGQVKQ